MNVGIINGKKYCSFFFVKYFERKRGIVSSKSEEFYENFQDVVIFCFFYKLF